MLKWRRSLLGTCDVNLIGVDDSTATPTRVPLRVHVECHFALHEKGEPAPGASPGKRNQVIRNAWHSKKPRCRELVSIVSCARQADLQHPLMGHAKRDPRGKSRPIWSVPISLSKSTEITCHGGASPNAAPNIVNKLGSSHSAPY